MKQYVVDQLSGDDFEKLGAYLKKNYGQPQFDSIFWLPVDILTLSQVQLAHKECQPFYIVIDLHDEQMVCELLVRTKNKMRCDCMGYATGKQRNAIIDLVDGILNQLEITT